MNTMTTDTDMITPAQSKRLHALLTQTKQIFNKTEIVAGFTEGRTTHSSEMTQHEAFLMIDHLQSKVKLQTVLDDAKNKMRRKVIRLTYEMGWAPAKDWKTAVEVINTFCMGEKGLFKKYLNSHTHAELVQLVNQFESMYKKHLSKF